MSTAAPSATPAQSLLEKGSIIRAMRLKTMLAMQRRSGQPHPRTTWARMSKTKSQPAWQYACGPTTSSTLPRLFRAGCSYPAPPNYPHARMWYDRDETPGATSVAFGLLYRGNGLPGVRRCAAVQVRPGGDPAAKVVLFYESSTGQAGGIELLPPRALYRG